MILFSVALASVAGAGGGASVMMVGGGVPAVTGNTFTYVKDNSGTNYGTPATAQLLTVTAGNLIVAYVTVSNDGGVAEISVSDGTTTLTAGTARDQGNYRGQFFYLLSSVASGTVTYSASSSGADVMSISVAEISHTASATADQHNESGGASGYPTLTVANIATTGSGITFAGCYPPFTTVSAVTINGSAADGSEVNGTTHSVMAYSIIGSTYTGGAVFTVGGYSDWVGNIINFK